MSLTNKNQATITPGQQGVDNSSFIHHPPEQENFKNLDNNELLVFVSLALNTLCDRGVSLPPILPSAPKTTDIFDNAKFEYNAIHIRCRNEVWYQAIFILQDGITLDIIRNFSKLQLETVLNQAKLLWDASNSITEHHAYAVHKYTIHIY
jgi:hypothetical protein